MLVCIISVLFRILVQSRLPSLRWLFWVEKVFPTYISWFFWILFLNFSCFEGLYCVHKVIISFADSMELFCCFQQLFFIFVCFNSWKRVVRIPVLCFSLVLYSHDFSHFLFFFIIQFPMIRFFLSSFLASFLWELCTWEYPFRWLLDSYVTPVSSQLQGFRISSFCVLFWPDTIPVFSDLEWLLCFWCSFRMALRPLC